MQTKMPAGRAGQKAQKKNWFAVCQKQFSTQSCICSRLLAAGRLFPIDRFPSTPTRLRVGGYMQRGRMGTILILFSKHSRLLIFPRLRPLAPQSSRPFDLTSFPRLGKAPSLLLVRLWFGRALVSGRTAVLRLYAAIVRPLSGSISTPEMSITDLQGRRPDDE